MAALDSKRQRFAGLHPYTADRLWLLLKIDFDEVSGRGVGFNAVNLTKAATHAVLWDRYYLFHTVSFRKHGGPTLETSSIYIMSVLS